MIMSRRMPSGDPIPGHICTDGQLAQWINGLVLALWLGGRRGSQFPLAANRAENWVQVVRLLPGVFWIRQCLCRVSKLAHV